MKRTTAIFGVRLTRREREILDWIAMGLKTRQIAGKLSISEHTVYNHRKNVLRKKGARNCKQLLLSAVA